MTTTPRRLRSVAAAAGVALAFVTLLGCVPGASAPTPSSAPSESATPASELAGTTWSGVDSDGDGWVLELEDDGTVSWTFSFDPHGVAEETTGAAASDTWTQTGDTVAIHIEFDDGPVEISGAYAGPDAPIDATGSYDGGTFTLSLTRG